MTDMNKEDQELAEIFSGEKRELHPDTVHVTLGQPSKAISKKETTTQKAKDKPVEEQWEPVKERNWMDTLREGSKWVAVFGGLAILLWYWQVSGLMDVSVAVPSMCACTALAGWNLGKCARG